MRTLEIVGAASLALAMSGCIYTNVREPLSYRSPTPADVGGALGEEVKGSSCNHVILWLFAFGDGGYDAAVADARLSARAPLLADVRADTSLLNVLSVYQKQCTTVTGRVATLVAAAPSPVAPRSTQLPATGTASP